jgi:hypothetical protein
MSNLLFGPDQVMKQEQYTDLLREAKQYRLVKAATQPQPEPSQDAALRQAQGDNVSRRWTVGNLTRRLPILGPISQART